MRSRPRGAWEYQTVKHGLVLGLIESCLPQDSLSSMDRTDNRRRTIFLWVFLSAVTLAGFWPVLRNGFVNYDDPDYVSENPYVLRGLTW